MHISIFQPPFQFINVLTMPILFNRPCDKCSAIIDHDTDHASQAAVQCLPTVHWSGTWYCLSNLFLTKSGKDLASALPFRWELSL